jgi:hypothetical protein
MGLGYHMILSQEAMRDRMYRGELARLAKRGHFSIIDNGAAEGDQLPFEQVVTVANQVGADEIIMPDVLFDGKATLKATTDPTALSMVPPIRRMVVPQGNSWEEWEECLVSLLMTIDFASIGLAKHLERLEGGRAYASKVIHKHALDLNHNIHLLGVWASPYDEITCEYACNIRGIDTGAAIAYAQNGRLVTSDEHYSLDWNGPYDSRIAERNIGILNDWCSLK